MTAGGGEIRVNDVVEEVTGRPPKNFDTFVQENKAVGWTQGTYATYIPLIVYLLVQ